LKIEIQRFAIQNSLPDCSVDIRIDSLAATLRLRQALLKIQN
jgi:hypothetical protein